MATETTSKLFNKMSRLRSIIGDYIRNLFKIVSAIHFWSTDWVLIGKSTSWAKLMRNLFCENEFDLLEIEKKPFLLKALALVLI